MPALLPSFFLFCWCSYLFTVYALVKLLEQVSVRIDPYNPHLSGFKTGLIDGLMIPECLTFTFAVLILALSVVIVKALKIFQYPLMIMPPMPTADLGYDHDFDYEN
jgi:hypothetical protein